MAQFDVHRLGAGLVLDCQSDLLAHLNTRVVVPLIHGDTAPAPAHRFNPAFVIGDQNFVMDTQFISSVERRHLGAIVSSLAHRSFEITDALDILISGV
ncbi:MAG TPA: CcdB family protein [Sphingomicrobium sp.]|nr:CcdB family protein [Sphingomicrobium sp.]